MSLEVSSTQEIVIIVGLVGVAGAIAYYEYESSKNSGNSGDSDAPPDLCKGISQYHIPWWEEAGAVIVTGGLALGAVGAYEGCKWYEAPKLQSLVGTVKVGIFQGTWQAKQTQNGDGWDFDYTQPVIKYDNYTYDQIGDLKRQYKGREKYLVFAQADVDYWKGIGSETDTGFKRATDAFRKIIIELENVNNQLTIEYSDALISNEKFPFTESYLRGKFSSAGLYGQLVDDSVKMWLDKTTAYSNVIMRQKAEVILQKFEQAVDAAERTATSSSFTCPPLVTQSDIPDPTLFTSTFTAEEVYCSSAQGRLWTKFPPKDSQDALLARLISSWYITVDAAKLTKNWPAQPSIADIQAQGCDLAHATNGYFISKAYLDAAKLTTK